MKTISIILLIALLFSSCAGVKSTYCYDGVAAYQKGLTNITVSWSNAMSDVPGWKIESDQVKYMRLGLDIDVAIEKIKNIKVV